MRTNFTLDGVHIKCPYPFKSEVYNVTTLSRLANAKMVGDFIARKHKFYFTYDAITGRELNVILDILYGSSELFFPLTYIEDNVQKEATVYAGSIPKTLHHTGDDWVWKDVSFSLIEQ